METYTFSLEATATTGKIRIYASPSAGAGNQVRVERVSIRAAAVDVVAPTLSSAVWDDGAGSGSVVSSEAGTFYLATYDTTAPTADGSGGWTGTTLETFTGAVVIGSNSIDPAETIASATATHFAYYVRDEAGNDSAVITQAYTPEFAPTSAYDFEDDFDGTAATTIESRSGWDAGTASGYTVDGSGNLKTPNGGGTGYAKTTATHGDSQSVTLEGVQWNGTADVVVTLGAHLGLSGDESTGFSAAVANEAGVFTVQLYTGTFPPITSTTQAAVLIAAGVDISTDLFDLTFTATPNGADLDLEVFINETSVLTSTRTSTTISGGAGFSSYSEGDTAKFWSADKFGVSAT